MATYADPAVAAACLALQDRWGADVNLLLYCCWLGQRGRALDKRALCAAIAIVRALQSNIIGPLRESRRALGRAPNGVPRAWAKQLKDRLAAVEIDLEYIEQHLLHAAAARLAPTKPRLAPRTAIAATLSRYLTLLEVPLAHGDRRYASTLLDACFPVAAFMASGPSRQKIRTGRSPSTAARRS